MSKAVTRLYVPLATIRDGGKEECEQHLGVEAKFALPSRDAILYNDEIKVRQA